MSHHRWDDYYHHGRHPGHDRYRKKHPHVDYRGGLRHLNDVPPRHHQWFNRPDAGDNDNPAADYAPPASSYNIHRGAYMDQPPERVEPSAGLAAQGGDRYFRASRTAHANLDNHTCVYNIAAGTVTLPDGEVFGAHSGIGRYQDDPRYCYARNAGPTPTGLYDFSLRGNFHGYQALRLNPEKGTDTHGRSGLLAHGHLLRGSNGSHGCTSFDDYNGFLAACRKQGITRMRVNP